MKKIYKFIFFGTGLGLHLMAIHEKIKSNVYFIIEDDLELFKLSMFTTDYEALTASGAVIYFSVFEDQDAFKAKAKLFLNEMYIYNHYLKFFHILSHGTDKIKAFQNVVAKEEYLIFNHAAVMQGLLRPLEHFKAGYKFLNIYKSYEDNPLRSKPLLLLGAGPSLHKNLDWLKANHEKFIIIAVSALLSTLEKANVRPDIITHVHGFDDCLKHVQSVENPEFFDKSIELFGTFTPVKFAAFFKKDNLYLFEGHTYYKNKFGNLGASNNCALTYGLSFRLNPKELYLLGLDFALDQETGASHTDGHAYTKKLDLHQTINLEDDTSYTKSTITVKGNFRDEVTTTLIFDSFRLSAIELANHMKNKLKT